MKIGFFDSGVGGITVLHDALKVLPEEDYLYYADTTNVPYGPKSKDQVKQYIFEAMEFITRQGVKAIVIACNTATSVAIEELREKYSIPIIGMEPAVKPAVEGIEDMNKRILVTATALTLKEEKLQRLIDEWDSRRLIDRLPLPGLVQFAEKFEFDEQIVLPYLKEQFAPFDLNRYETVVLGCTHFPLFKDAFRKLLPPSVHIIDGGRGTVNNLKRILGSTDSLGEGSGKILFYHSGIPVTDSRELKNYRSLLERMETVGP
ncbi:glutamate racemase [Lachnospiraceae bacterium 54-53]